MDSPNWRLDGGTDNQSAKTDIMRELVRKEANLAQLVERIERIGKMSWGAEDFSPTAGGELELNTEMW